MITGTNFTVFWEIPLSPPFLKGGMKKGFKLNVGQALE